LSDAANPSRLDRLRSVVAENPGSADAHLKLGAALLKAKLPQEAEQALNRAVELDPKNGEAWVNLGGLCFARMDFEGAVAACRRALECSPELVPAHYNLGLGHLYLEQPGEMLGCFDRVVELDPPNAGGHYHRAVALHALGRDAEAQAALNAALTLGYAPQPEFVRAMGRNPKNPTQAPPGAEEGVQVVEFDPEKNSSQLANDENEKKDN